MTTVIVPEREITAEVALCRPNGRLNPAAVNHRRFWDAMDRLGEGQLRETETRLSRRIVTEFGLDPTGLALDTTKLRHLHRHPRRS